MQKNYIQKQIQKHIQKPRTKISYKKGTKCKREPACTCIRQTPSEGIHLWASGKFLCRQMINFTWISD